MGLSWGQWVELCQGSLGGVVLGAVGGAISETWWSKGPALIGYRQDVIFWILLPPSCYVL